MESSPQPPRGGDSATTSAAADRRGFLAQATAVVLGGAALLIPTVTGMVALLSPLRRKSRAGQFLRVTSLAALPDGTPRRFPVVADRTDAWNRFAKEPIGAVFLRRTGDPDNPVQALHVVCPHAGCHVQYKQAPDGGKFFCPCHGASFDLSGKRLEDPSESPRPMDELEVDPQRLQQGEVWVKFQNFKTGTSEKVERT